MSSRRRWLWLTAELPIELNTGRLVYSHRLVDGLRQAGIDVTVVGAAVDADRAGVPSHWRVVDEGSRGGWRSLFSRLPNLSYACSGSTFRAAVQRALRETWDAIVIDHLQMAWVVPLLGEASDAAVVFVTHNHEASVRRRVAAEHPVGPRRLALQIDAAKARRWEVVALDRADVVTAITDADRRAFEADAPSKRYLVLPPGWTGDEPTAVIPFVERPRRVGVLGSFDWHVKQENLRRLLRATDSVLPSRGIELVVAGTVPHAFRDEIDRCHPWVNVAGWVDHPGTFLQTLRLGIVAEPLGGGFKLKSLDYVFNRVPVAALSGSLEGIPLVGGTSMFEASSMSGLADLIAEVIDDVASLERCAEAAESACRGRFDWSSRSEALARAVESVLDALPPAG